MSNEIEETLDFESLMYREDDTEARKKFIDNFLEILGKTNEINCYTLQEYMKDPELKKLIMDNVSEVLKKTNNRDVVMKYVLPKELAIQNPQIYFVEYKAEDKVNYREIIKELEKHFYSSEVLDLVIENMDNIVKDSGYNFPQVICELDNLLDYASSEQLEQVDEKLTKNIDNILKIKINKGGYDINIFRNMPKFIDEIRKRGPEFFINFPITNPKKEHETIFKEIFGKYDEEIFSILEFGKYDKSKAEMMKYIITELIKASSEGATVQNIKEIGRGSYSIAYKIGDYVLKIGKDRCTRKIPNHRRVLQPIIRKKILTDRSNEDEEAYDFFEVQNYTDTSCFKSMFPSQRDEIAYEIYSELRDDGILWLDPSYRNIGKLLKPNRANLPFTNMEGETEDIRPTEEATDLIRRSF